MQVAAVSQPSLCEKRLGEYRKWKTVTDKNYQPYLKVKSFRSAGIASQIYGVKSRRAHVTFSMGEEFAFLSLEADHSVIEIREQYALPPNQTLRAAQALNIAHPAFGNRTTVMTTDFLVAMNCNGKRQWVALSYKPNDVMSDPGNKKDERASEKLEIERYYWESLVNIPWKLITSNDVCKTEVSNIKFLRSAANIDQCESLIGFSEKDFLNFKGHLEKLMAKSPKSILKNLLDAICRKMEISFWAGVNIFKHLVWHRIVPLDISQPIALTSPLPRR